MTTFSVDLKPVEQVTVQVPEAPAITIRIGDIESVTVSVE